MATQGFQARGQDVLVRLKINNEVDAIDFTSVEIDWGMEIRTSEYVGGKTDIPYGANKSARLRFTAEPNNDKHHKLIALQRQANGPNATRITLQIDVTLTTDYGPGGRPRWAFNSCTFGMPNQRNGAPSDKVQNTFELACPEPEPLTPGALV